MYEYVYIFIYFTALPEGDQAIGGGGGGLVWKEDKEGETPDSY